MRLEADVSAHDSDGFLCDLAKLIIGLKLGPRRTLTKRFGLARSGQKH
jgi:hypothetical protein